MIKAEKQNTQAKAESQDGPDTGIRPRVVEGKLTIEALIDAYFRMVKARGLAPKTLSKYETDLNKLKEFCKEKKVVLAHRFGREQFYDYREWLVEQEYADKTVYGALTLCKQVFKWGHHE